MQAALPVLALGLLGAQAPVFRAEIGLVVLQATVTNARGETVTDLPRGAFRVYENGRPQTITLFRHGQVPVSLGILLDNSRSVREKRGAVEAAALAALASQNAADETFLMNFADKASLDVPLTSDQEALRHAVARRDAIGGTAMRDAVAQAVAYLAGSSRAQRKALLLITDANDNASLVERDRLCAEATRQEVLVFAVGVLNEDLARARIGREALLELVAATGGSVAFAASLEEARAAGASLADRIRHLYTIGYTPTEQALDGSYRRLRVLAGGGERLRVRTRDGYRATSSRLPSP